MGVKIEHIQLALKIKIFSKCISDGHVCWNIGTTKVKIAKIYALVRRNLVIYTEN